MIARALRLPALSTVSLCVVALVGALVGVASPVQADDNPCTATRFEIKQVEQACKVGGRVAAKKMMNDAVKKAKAAGETMNCKTCHTDVKETFALKADSDAVVVLKRWL